MSCQHLSLAQSDYIETELKTKASINNGLVHQANEYLSKK